MAALLRSRALTQCSRAAVTRPAPPAMPPRRFKSSGKKGKGKERAYEREMEDELEAPDVTEIESSFGTRINKGKAHKGTITVIEGEKDLRDGEQFDIDTMKLNMDKAVEQLRLALKPIMGQITAALDTSVVDNLTVEHHEMGRLPIGQLAAVSKTDKGGLKVSVFSSKDMMAVESTLKEANLRASRSGNVANAFLVLPMPFDQAARQSLLKRANDIVSQAEAKGSRAREAAHKALKADFKNKVVNDREFRRESKEMDDEARKRLNEMGNIRAEAKRLILDQ